MKKYEAAAAEIEKTILEKNGKGRLPTEKELCARLSVSRQTVRSALSLLEDKGYIRKVQGSGIYLTGLVPDKRRGRIVLIVPDENAGPFPSLIRGMRSVFSAHGFFLDVQKTGADFSMECGILKKIAAKDKADGSGVLEEGVLPEAVFMVPDALQLTFAGEYILRLKDRGCPVFFVFHGCQSLPDVPVIAPLYEEASFLLTKKLTDAGCRNIFGIFDPGSLSALFGFLSCLKAEGLDYGKSRYLVLPSGSFDDRSFSGLIQSCILPGVSSLNAILCSSDYCAGALLFLLDREGIRIPEDIFVCCIGGQHFHSPKGYNLTRMQLRNGAIEEAAWQAFSEKMAGKNAAFSASSLPWDFIPGNTCMLH